MLAREHQLADILIEVQNGLTGAESTQFPSLLRSQFPCGWARISCNKFWLADSPLQEQVEKISCYILSKQVKSQMSDEAKKIKFRESLRIALETTIPLDQKEATALERGTGVNMAEGIESLRIKNDSVYEINKFSPLCNETTRKQVLDFLNKNCDDFDTKADVIREVCSNGRFEAALNLARTEENKSGLLRSGVPKQIIEVLKILIFPGAVEKEYMRGKTRFANYENCQQRLPRFMNLYSSWVELRCERVKIFRFVDKLPERYRSSFEEDLRMIENALGISDEIILRTAFFRWLKKEHFNNVQDARIELLDAWVEDNLEEVGLALAHRAIYSGTELSSLIEELKYLCSVFDTFGDEEENLLEDAEDAVRFAVFLFRIFGKEQKT